MHNEACHGAMMLKQTVLILGALILLGFSEPSQESRTLVPQDVIMDELIKALVRRPVSIDVPRQLENKFTVVFDDLADLKPDEKKLVDELQLERIAFSDISIKVELDDVVPLEEGREKSQRHFYLNAENDVRVKVASFRLKADVTVTRKGRNVFGAKRQPIRAVLDTFEMQDIESLLRFYLGQNGSTYYAEHLTLQRLVLSPRATIKLEKFPPAVNKIISDCMGPVIADVGNTKVLNESFYSQFNANLPARVPERGLQMLPPIFQDILK